MTGLLSDQPLDDPVVGFAQRHPALAAAAATTVAFVVKVLFVTNLNTDVALAIVAATGPAELIIGLAVVLFPALALLITYALGVAAIVYYRSGRRAALLFEMTVLAAILTLGTMPLGSLLFIAGLGLLVVAIWLVMHRLGRSPAGLRPDAAQLAGVTVLSTLVVFLALPTMWLPPENYNVLDQRLSMAGYFIEDDGEWVTVLQEPDRRLVRLRAEQIQDRRLCRLTELPDLLATPLYGLLRGGLGGSIEGCSAASSAIGPIP